MCVWGHSPFPQIRGSARAWPPYHLYRMVWICRLRLYAVHLSEGIFCAQDLTPTSGFSSSCRSWFCGSLRRQIQRSSGSCYSLPHKTSSCPRIKVNPPEPGPPGDSFLPYISTRLRDSLLSCFSARLIVLLNKSYLSLFCNCWCSLMCKI